MTTKSRKHTVRQHTIQTTAYRTETDMWLDIEVLDSPVVTDIDIERYDGTQWKILFNQSDGGDPDEVAALREEKEDALHLYHLEIPEQNRGSDLGRLTIKLVQEILQVHEYREFSMKFGGGCGGSCGFLRAVGFSDGDVDTVKDSDCPEPSVVVGDIRMESVTSSVESWALYPISVERFPDVATS